MFASVDTCAPSPIVRHSASEASRAAAKRASSSGVPGLVAAIASAYERRMLAA